MKLLNYKVMGEGKVRVDHCSFKKITDDLYHIFLSTNTRYPGYSFGGTSSSEESSSSIVFSDNDEAETDGCEIEFSGDWRFYMSPAKDQFHIVAMSRDKLMDVCTDMTVIVSNNK